MSKFRKQKLQCFLYCFGTSREIDDQRFFSDT